MTLVSRPPLDLDEFKELLFRCAHDFVQIRDWSQAVCNENKELIAALQASTANGLPDKYSDAVKGMIGNSSVLDSLKFQKAQTPEDELMPSRMSYAQFSQLEESHEIAEVREAVIVPQHVSSASSSLRGIPPGGMLTEFIVHNEKNVQNLRHSLASQSMERTMSARRSRRTSHHEHGASVVQPTLQSDQIVEMQQHQELEKWFMQLKPAENSYLTPLMIQRLTNLGYSETPRSLDWVQTVMLDLNEHMETVLDIHIEAESESEESPHHNMHFPAFCELIQWSNLASVPDHKAKQRILEVRAAIIRNSVDQLISKHTHLDMPDESNTAQKQKRPWEQVVDIIVGFAIVLNAITIGINADLEWTGFQVTELFFTTLFTFEILFKIKMHGFCHQFRGPDYLWNLFDVVIVVLALFDAAMSYIVNNENDLGNVGVMKMARLARLTRLMRLLRLLRLRIFKELLLMVKGVVAGLRTLFWAIVLLVFVVYIVGVLLRQTVGEDQIRVDSGLYEAHLFDTVSWSMFNVFRCFTADCTLQDGTPIVVHLYEAYGWKFVFPYALIMLFITFGIFNLIMAIFVENVMESARQKRQLTETAERNRVCRSLRELILKFGGSMEVQMDMKELPKKADGKSGTSSDKIVATGTASSTARSRASKTYIVEVPHFQFGGQISRDLFQKVIFDAEAQMLLEDLEVHIGDRSELFDVLDADGSGFLDVSELIAGLLKLRSGGADKSDVVAAILGIRSLHKTFTNFMQLALENHRTLHEKAEVQEHIQEHMLEMVSRQKSFFEEAHSDDSPRKVSSPKSNGDGVHHEEGVMDTAGEVPCRGEKIKLIL